MDGYGLALAALVLVVFGAYDSYPSKGRLNWDGTQTWYESNP